MSDTKDKKDLSVKDKALLVYKAKTKEEIGLKTKNIEANIVSCFWKDPQLYLDYSDIKDKHFKNPIWKFYFNLGNKLASKSIKKIEATDVDLLIDGKEAIIETYEKQGGFDTISDLQEVCIVENVQSYISELFKWNVIWDIIDKFTVDSSQFENVENLSSDEVYDYYSVLLNNSFLSTTNNYIASDLKEGIEDIIENANKGLNQGLPINSPNLSDEIGGLQLGQMYLIGAGSGTGKSTFLLDVVLPSFMQLNEQACFILNEQDAIKTKQQFLTYIINNMVISDPNKYFSSKRWREGHFSEEEMSWLKNANEILDENLESKKIIILELKTYNRKEVARLIKQYAGLGCKYFFLDTLKLSNDAGDNYWLSLMQDCLAYSDLIKPASLNIHLTLTAQLQKLGKGQRYLDNSNIGMSKSIIDTASVVILFRRFYADEYPNMKREIKVKKRIDGTNSLDEVVLNPNHHYQLAFISKNRNGSSEEYQIVSRQELGYLVYNEVGITNIMPD